MLNDEPEHLALDKQESIFEMNQMKELIAEMSAS